MPEWLKLVLCFVGVFGGVSLLGIISAIVSYLIVDEKIKIPRWIKIIMRLFNGKTNK